MKLIRKHLYSIRIVLVTGILFTKNKTKMKPYGSLGEINHLNR